MSAESHFQIAGIPVRIEPVFWIVTVFFAFNLQDPALIVMWVGVVLVSILVHELGHAFALKAFGQSSSIVLHGFGGFTLSQRRLRRTQSILVSLAGPLSALALLGVPAYLLRESDVGIQWWFDYDGGFGLWPLVYFAVYVNIWWSIANLLPIRPLDGGNVMTELIGIDKARILSIVVGAAAAVWAYTHSDAFRYAAFFAAFLAFINFSEYRRSRTGEAAPSAFDVEGPAPGGGRDGGVPPGQGHPSGRPGPSRDRSGWPTGPPQHRPPMAPAQPRVSDIPGGVDPTAAESFAWNLLRKGDAAGARRVLDRATGDVGPFVRATTQLAAGEGIEPLVSAYLANPSGPSNLVPASVAADGGQAVALAQRLVGSGPGGADAAGSIQTHLHYAERFEHAAAVGEIVYAAVGPSKAQTAFDVACAWSRAGQADRGLHWVRRAISDGFAARNLLDGEPDLALVRAAPGWAEVRGQLG